MSITSGTKLGRYEIRSKIGEGGMGEVYLARDEKISRDVAIKVLPATFSADAERLRRFEQEAQAAGALNHPNILVVYDVGTTAMERALIYADTEKGQSNLWSQPIDGSKRAPITNFRSETITSMAAFAPSRDGKRMAVARGYTTGDIVLIKGFR